MPNLGTVRSMILKSEYTKYLLGGLLIATLIVTFHQLRKTITHSKQMYATEINVSGYQRMLSQRTALLVQLLATAKNKDVRSNLRNELLTAIETMKRNHEGLIHGDPDTGLAGALAPGLDALFYKPPFEVDANIRSYLNILTNIAQIPDNQLSLSHPLLKMAGKMALYDLLPALDAVVKQYELESKSAAARTTIGINTLLIEVAVLTMVIVLFLGFYIITINYSREKLLLSDKIFDNALEGIVVTDSEGSIQRTNPAFTNITGYEPAEVLGKNTRILKSGVHTPEYYEEMWNSIHKNGCWQGEMWKRRRDGTLVPTWQSIASIKDHHGKVIHYTAIFTDISKQKEKEEALRYQSHHDALTGLPNRMFFLKYLDQCQALAKRKNMLMAVMLLDLNRFKAINDTLGHAAGDQLLQEVAKRLKSCIRESDMTARLGGDEFTIVLPDIAREEDALQVGEKIIASFAKPFWLAGAEIPVTTSIGISIYPSDGKNIDALISHADEAMYHAKKTASDISTVKLYRKGDISNIQLLQMPTKPDDKPIKQQTGEAYA